MTIKRDTRGRFASQPQSEPEANLDGHYDWEDPLFDLDESSAGSFQRWTDETANEYFAQEPDMTPGTESVHDPSTWGKAPF